MPMFPQCFFTVHFETNSGVLSNEAKETLDKFLASCATEIEGRVVAIMGQADSPLDPERKLDAARPRAEAVRAYLLSKSIRAKSIGLFTMPGLAVSGYLGPEEAHILFWQSRSATLPIQEQGDYGDNRPASRRRRPRVAKAFRHACMAAVGIGSYLASNRLQESSDRDA
jgi:OmpA family